MKKYNSLFSNAVTNPVDKGTNIPSEDVVEYSTIQVVKRTGEGESDFILEDKVIEVARVDRTALINSHRDDVGIENIIKKMSISGDLTLANQRPAQEGFVDITHMPTNFVDAMNQLDAAKAQEEASGLKAEEVAGWTPEQIKAYIDAQLAQLNGGKQDE